MSARTSGITVLLAGAAYALAGCGSSASDQVRAKVQQFARAVTAKDAGTLCGEVLATTLLERFAAVGLPCDRAMQTFLSSVHNPSLQVGRVVVKGKQAEAIILTRARGQEGSLDALELVDTSAGWRVYGLGQSVLPGGTGGAGTTGLGAPGTTSTGTGTATATTGTTTTGTTTTGTTTTRTATTGTTTTGTTTTGTTTTRSKAHSSPGKSP